MKVIGTAGHIDHGKSTLVERLTGMDPDRLGEEKRRGMTIDLGFAWLTLPSGREVSIVDVPGHERFIKNMLAGAAGIDVALLVIAADEGVMPQTREHLDILDLLEVRRGVIALTKSDLVDADWLEFVGTEAQEVLEGTALAGSPIVPVSARTGEGLEDLVAALDRAVGADRETSPDGLPFLPVDRVFTVPGFGTVVTGTLHGGRLSAGDEVEVLPAGRRARVRGIQTHRRAAERVAPGTRAALNLAPVSHHEIVRGDVVALPGSLLVTRRVAARVRVLSHLAGGLVHGLRVAVHAGASEVPGTVIVLGDDRVASGGTGWIQLKLDRATPVVRGQHFVLRLPAPLGTVAGGTIVDLQPRGRRHDATVSARLERLASADHADAVRVLLDDARSLSPVSVARLLSLPESRARHLLAEEERQGRAVCLDEQYVGATYWTQIERRVVERLAAFHEASPLEPGMRREELRKRIGLLPGVGSAAITRLTERGVLTARGHLIALPGRGGGAGARPEEVARVLRVLRHEPFSPPSGAELLDRARTDRALLDALARDGRIVRLSEGLYLDSKVYEEMVAEVVRTIERDGEITVAALRDRYGTSRKYALALLEHLDDERITRRQGEGRVFGSKRPACV